MKFTTAIALLQLLPLSCSFSVIPSQRSPWVQATPFNVANERTRSTKLGMSSEDKTEPRSTLTNFSDADQNRTYIEGLLQNLSATLDRWIVTGSNVTVRCNGWMILSIFTFDFNFGSITWTHRLLYLEPTERESVQYNETN